MINRSLSSLSDTYFRDPADFVRRVYVEESCVELPYTKDILSRAGCIPVVVIKDGTGLSSAEYHYPQNFTQGKRDLLLCRNRGKFFKPCPGTSEYRCCGYQVLNTGMNCPMDCVYCILQAYLNNPWLSFFVNVDEALDELRLAFRTHPGRFWRIGTGEFSDSMALDRLTRLSRILVEFMSDKKSAVLELKTKTAVVDHLRGLNHGGRTIAAWSLNSPLVMSRWEFRTSPLECRLHAASDCASWGYRLAFHFDPVIYHPGWERGYAETVERLFNSVPRERITWISMGCLRFLPPLKPLAMKRFAGSRFFHEEFVPGLDGKSRYFRSLRVEMYKRLYDLLNRRASPDTCIYLCMESDEIWRDVFGFTPEEHGGLSAMLDRAAAGG